MPLLSLHMLRLNIFTSVAVFLQELHAEKSIEVVLASRPRHVIIKPSVLDQKALAQRYELVILLRSPNAAIPSNLRGHVWYEYKVNVGIPSRVLNSYPERNAKLLTASPNVKLSGALERRGKEELDTDLYKFMETLTKSYGDKPITMLNLLHFNSKDAKESYKKYGQAFVPIAAKRGGDAKIVGNVVHLPSNGPASPVEDPKGSKDGEWWDEISLVHYPSIRAFCDMLVGEDYQDINKKFRLNALKDTMLMCTTEIGLDSARRSAKM